MLLNGMERRSRTTLLRFLSGESFISKYRCPLFKRHPGTKCPFCQKPTRNTSHYMLTCEHFSSQRTSYFRKLCNIDPQITHFITSSPESDHKKSVFLLSSKPSSDSINLTRAQRESLLKHTANFLHELRPYFMSESVGSRGGCKP